MPNPASRTILAILVPLRLLIATAFGPPGPVAPGRPAPSPFAIRPPRSKRPELPVAVEARAARPAAAPAGRRESGRPRPARPARAVASGAGYPRDVLPRIDPDRRPTHPLRC